MNNSWKYDLSGEPNASSVNASPGNEGNSPAPGARGGELTDGKSSTGSTNPRIRRRNRLITSCLECRRRKLKCDKTSPCANCVRFKRECLYLTSSLDPASQQKLADIKERMGALERNLEREVAGQGSKGSPETSGLSGSRGVDDDHEADFEVGDEEELEAPPLTSLDNFYAEDADDELVDLGVQMGKMRVTERIGGFIRPKAVTELTNALEGADREEARRSDPIANNNEGNYRSGLASKIQAASKSYIGPGPDYIAPSSSFLFPGTNLQASLIDFLPSKKVADELIAQYFIAVHELCRCLHRPTFEAAYERFWNQIAMGREPIPSSQAVIFAAMLSAAVSMSESQVLQQFGATRTSLVESMRSGTEFALCKANLLRATRFETIQAFVMYLIPQIRGEVSRAHSALVGTAIRLAECMGLHRDGISYGLNPVEVQMRRFIWHQLSFLDMRTCDATGPRPQIRADDFDTQYPWNIDDVALTNATTYPTDQTIWTDASFARIRAETSDVRRRIWFDCLQIDKKKKSLTSVLIKIQKLRTAMEARFTPILDESIPFHKLTKALFLMFSNGLFLSALHRYLFNTTPPMPDRLRQVLIEAAVVTLETGVLVDSDPDLAPWAWYRGALNQFHVALLLLMEIHTYPMRKEAPRIWRSLDYVFDIPPQLSPKQKGDLVLTDLRDRLGVYHQMRKLRSETTMDEEHSRFESRQRAQASASPNPPAAMDIPQQGIFATGQTPSLSLAAGISPPSGGVTESNSSASRHGSMQSGNAGNAMLLDDIDWAEWDRYFPHESNTGDLNIPDFDFAAFSGEYNNAPLDPSTFATMAEPSIGVAMPSAEDLSDIQFTPTFYPNVNTNGTPAKLNVYPGSWMGV